METVSWFNPSQSTLQEIASYVQRDQFFYYVVKNSINVEKVILDVSLFGACNGFIGFYLSLFILLWGWLG